MKMDTLVRNALVTATGVIVAGAILYFGRDLPGIKQARNGFQGII